MTPNPPWLRVIPSPLHPRPVRGSSVPLSLRCPGAAAPEKTLGKEAKIKPCFFCSPFSPSSGTRARILGARPFPSVLLDRWGG